MASWQPGISSWSPNRVDALVWVLSELMLGAGAYGAFSYHIDPPGTADRPSIWDGSAEIWFQRRYDNRPWPSIWDRDPDKGMFG